MQIFSNSWKSFLSYGLFGATIFFLLLPLLKGECYSAKYLSFRTTESSNYRFVMTLHDNNTLSSISHVLEDIKVPMWNFIFVRQPKRHLNVKQPRSMLIYNGTHKVCNFLRYARNVPIFNKIAYTLLKEPSMGNMSLDCPLKAGTYILQNIHIPPNTPILKIFFEPNQIYTLFGNVYAQLPNKKLVLKCSYEINGTFLKSC